MTDLSPRTRRTSVSLRDLHAEALHRLLLSPDGRVESLEDIARLPQLARWNPLARDVAIADLVADGLLVDDQRGRPYAVRRA